MSRRRIAVVCYPSVGGSGVIATALASGLATRGHEMHLISTAPPTRSQAGPARLRFEPVRVTEYPIYEHSNYTVAVAAAIVETVRKHAIEVLHVHYAVPHAASALLARSILGAKMPKTIITLHGTDVSRAPDDPSAKLVTRFAVEAADLITVPSEFLAQEAHTKLGVSSEREVQVTPNFVDIDRFRPARSPRVVGPEQPLVLVHVSNLRPVKRPRDLIAVLERVRTIRPARLRVVGDGPGQADLQQLVHERGLEHEVELLGRLADPSEVLRASDVFVLPSASESFGVAGLEALASGVPVVGYRVGGLPEVVTEDSGRLVAAHDVGALAEAVLEITRTPTLYQQLRTGARERAVSMFAADAALDRFETLLEELAPLSTDLSPHP